MTEVDDFSSCTRLSRRRGPATTDEPSLWIFARPELRHEHGKTHRDIGVGPFHEYVNLVRGHG